MNKKYLSLSLLLSSFLVPPALLAAEKMEEAKPTTNVKVEMFKTTADMKNNGMGDSIGYVELEDTPNGLIITPKLKGLTPGEHGFHVHENPECGPSTEKGTVIPGGKAGGHLDPNHTHHHLGPKDPKGHLGDLPVLTVDSKGEANNKIVDERLKLKDIMNRSLIIHEGGDNYSDSPKPFGGGGARVACGIVK